MTKVLDRHICGTMPIGVCVEYYDEAWRVRMDSRSSVAVTHCPWCGHALQDVEPTALVNILAEMHDEVVKQARSIDCACSYVLGKHYPESYEHCSAEDCDECRSRSLLWLHRAVKDLCNEQETE